MMRVPGFVRVASEVTIGLAVLLVAAAATAGPRDLPLIDAVRSSDRARLAALLDQRVNPDASLPDGTTALHWAVRVDDPVAVDALIRAGANVRATTRFGVTPLALAATNGSALVLERLLAAGADPNVAQPTGETPLMTTARGGRVDAVRALLAAGAAVDAAEPALGQTALMWAASEGHVDAVRTLVEAGANIHGRSKNGFTPLLFAVRDGRLDAVAALVDAGASVHDRVRDDLVSQSDRMDMGPDGSSTVALAILNGHYDVGAWLLEHGADAAAPDPRGTLLHTLAWMRRPGKNASPRLHQPEPDGVVGSLDLAKALLAHGADPNVRIGWEERKPRTGNAISFGYMRSPGNMDTGISYMSFVGATPFYLAARSSDTALMRLLLAWGADPTIPTVRGVTPFMAAAGVGYYNGQSPGPAWGVSDAEVFEALVLAWSLGVDINGVTREEAIPDEFSDPAWALDHPTGQFDQRWGRSTALHGAVLRESLDVIRFLVDKGARLDAQNQLGWTPLSVATGIYTGGTFRVYPETIALLRQLMHERRLDDSATIVCTSCGRSTTATAGR